jgi:hypothetical protein
VIPSNKPLHLSSAEWHSDKSKSWSPALAGERQVVRSLETHVKRITTLAVFAVCGALTAHAESVDLCGEIEAECFFVPYNDPGIYYLPDVPEELRSQPIIVRGEVTNCSETCATLPISECLVATEIKVCLPETLGCGVLEPWFDQYCGVWASATHGRAEIYNYFGFAPGDTVLAIGYVQSYFLTTCMIANKKLSYYELLHCITGGTPVRKTTWGYVKARFKD